MVLYFENCCFGNYTIFIVLLALQAILFIHLENEKDIYQNINVEYCLSQLLIMVSAMFVPKMQ